jgi:hypothetical protein
MFKTFADWFKDNPPPDLQTLALIWGGLGNVPSAELDAFAREREQWLIRLRDR